MLSDQERLLYLSICDHVERWLFRLFYILVILLIICQILLRFDGFRQAVLQVEQQEGRPYHYTELE